MLGIVVVEARRLTGDIIAAALVALIAGGMKLALRAHPVRVKSACLKFRTYSCSAFIPDSSTTSCIRWTMVLGACSLHHTVAAMVPLSPAMLTILC